MNMPYPNEHAARVTEPDKYESFAREKIADGIDAIYGIKDGKSEIQAYRFDKDKFTVDEAKKWLDEHDIKYILFEPAKKELSTRMLSIASFDNARYTELDDGGIIFPAILLTPGEYTDSAVQTPLVYPSDVIEKYAQNWVDNKFWARHELGLPRGVLDELGEVRNPRYANGALMADIYLHRLTQPSKDMASLMKARKGQPLSVEHTWVERYDAENDKRIAESLTFLGLAPVPKGACPEARAMSETAYNQTKKEEERNLVEEKKLEEMSKRLSDLESSTGELKKSLSALDEKISKTVDAKGTEIAKELAMWKEKANGFEERIKALETTPEPKVKQLSNDSIDTIEEYVDDILVLPSGTICRRDC